MFQTYAVTYKISDEDQEYRIASVLDLDEVAEWVSTLGPEGARDLLIRKMVAAQRWGRPQDEQRVSLTRVERLGLPSEFPR